MTTNRRRPRGILLLVLLMIGLAPVVRGQPEPKPSGQGGTAAPVFVLPFELASNKLYMQTKVNAEGPYPFVLDTGAPFTVLDWDLAEELRLQIFHTGEAGGAGEGTVKLGTTLGARITIGPLRYQPRRMEVIPLNRTLSTAEGRDVMGLLGGDVMARFVSEFDFEDREVRLYPQGHEYAGKGERIPVTLDGHVLARATVKFGGREPISGRFIVDTGARIAVSLNTHVVNENRLIAGDIASIKTTIGWGLGGPLDHHLARAEMLTIGEVAFEAPTVTLSQDTRGVFAGRRVSGVIGTEVLKRCRVTFDYGREQMFLEPVDAAMKRPFPADCSGLFITASGADHRVYTVRTVVTHSPASEAGIVTGDVIERLDGGPVVRFTLEELRDLLREPHKTYEMELQRGEERRKLKLVTRPMI